MKVYSISRRNDRVYNGRVHAEVCLNTKSKYDDYALKHIVLHSPDGFEYGYGGSGPSDLALAILADYFNGLYKDFFEANDYLTSEAQEKFLINIVSKYYQKFKWVFIATRERDEPFSITEEEIKQWLSVVDAPEEVENG